MGFIKTREARVNVVRTINLIYLAKNKKIYLVLLGIDGFDRLNWVFMEEVLQKYGLGGNLIKCV